MAAKRFVHVYAAQVDDEATYQRYRTGMLPILAEHGGAFRYDFMVAHAPISAASHPINRVFLIDFPSRAAAAALFADPRYLAVRRALFEPSVSAISQLAAFDEAV